MKNSKIMIFRKKIIKKMNLLNLIIKMFLFIKIKMFLLNFYNQIYLNNLKNN